MKTLIIFTFLLVFTVHVNSQPTWIQQNSGTTNSLNRLIVTSQNYEQRLFIVGDNGTILRTSNFGQVWEMMSSNTNSNLYSIEIPGNDTGYAVGSGGTIIRTTDGGITWTGMLSNTTNTLKEIRMMSGTVRALAVGENGTFMKLVNDVWSVTQIDTNDLNSITFESYNVNKYYVVGNNGLILKTLNGGTSWIRLNSSTTNNLNYILPMQNIIVGNNGTALQIDGSSAIIIINSGTVNNLYHISRNSYYSCGANGTILRYWQPLYNLFNDRLNSIEQTINGYSYIAGENGLILFAYSSTETSNSKLLNANNISSWFRNNGSFNRDPSTGNSGFEWPKGTAKSARYASGIWMGCKSGNDTLIAVAEYSYDYLPGYVDDFGNPQGSTDPAYRIYSITKGDSASPDYQSWPAYQGAYLNSNGRPYFLGTQTMFYSYTDAYPHSSNNSSLASLKAQILQTNWCYTNIGMEDVQFIEFRIINRSNVQWENTYLAFWTDDDLGTATDDAIGCDTMRNFGYTYNKEDIDPIYGPAPPAVGTKLLRSPVIFTGNNNDTVKYYNPPGSQNLIVKAGYKYSGMNVFNTYNNGSPAPADPQYYVEAYRVLEGKWKTGESWINPFNGQATKKAYSGDPVTGSGWIMPNGGDRRFIQSFGPFYMNPNDTQSIIVAQIIARGSSNLNSITRLRELSDHVQNIYDENFQSVLAVQNISTEIPDQFSLYQNYPNPFNPNTIINYELRVTSYAKLVVYDIMGREIRTLVNEKQSPGTYQIELDGSGLTSGVYFYRLTAGEFTDTKRMLLVK